MGTFRHVLGSQAAEREWRRDHELTSSRDNIMDYFGFGENFEVIPEATVTVKSKEKVTLHTSTMGFTQSLTKELNVQETTFNHNLNPNGMTSFQICFHHTQGE